MWSHDRLPGDSLCLYPSGITFICRRWFLGGFLNNGQVRQKPANHVRHVE